MNKLLLLILPVCSLFVSCIPVGIQTYLDSDMDQISHLLNVHYQIAETINVDEQESRFIFMGDFHRGYGDFDKFHFNEDLYCAVLNKFNDVGKCCRRRYSLVLMGDIEEGWGLQRNNIPLIQRFHEKASKAEEEFIKNNRYYRIYGNHDDIYRGGFLETKEYSVEVHPAIKICLRACPCPKSVMVNEIFVTHGSQGHSLHDAGDELAAWGVFMKHTYLQNMFFKREKEIKEKAEKVGHYLDENFDLQPKDPSIVMPAKDSDEKVRLDKETFKLKNAINNWFLWHGYFDNEMPLLPTRNVKKHFLSENEMLDVKKAKKTREDFKKHEKMVFEWAGSKNNRAIGTLILGHTHVPVFNTKVIHKNEDNLAQDTQSKSGYIVDPKPIFENLTRSDLSYHNTGAAGIDEIPCLVLTAGKFEYYIFKKKNNNKIVFNVISTDMKVSKEHDLSCLTEGFLLGTRRCHE